MRFRIWREKNRDVCKGLAKKESSVAIHFESDYTHPPA
jgi:hypothetical protein